MKTEELRILAVVVCAAIGGGGILAACGGDDTAAPSDGGAGDAPSGDDGSSFSDALAASDAAPDGGAPADASPEGGGDASDGGADANGTPPWLLLTINGTSSSELSALSMTKGAVEGRFLYPGFIGGSYIDGKTAWALEQSADRVVMLDPRAPWRGGPSWDVKLGDAFDGGKAYADPIAVVGGPTGKAYVLRYNRSAIAVLDTTQTAADGGAPAKVIDLASLRDPLDADGALDVAGGVYVAAKQRLYVLLGDVDVTLTAKDGSYTGCSALKPTVIAIDVTTDQVVSLGGTGKGGGIALDGYNPNFNEMIYDAPRDRLLVVNLGCNVPPATADAGPGALQRREVDAVDLTSGAPSRALDLTAKGFPSGFAWIDPGHVVLGFDFGFEAYVWDITQASLGAKVEGAPDFFTHDGKGSLVGTKTAYFADGGSSTTLLSVQVADGGVTPLGPLPAGTIQGFVGAVDYYSP